MPDTATMSGPRTPRVHELPSGIQATLDRLVQDVDDWTPKQLLILTQRHLQRLQRSPNGRRVGASADLELAAEIVHRFEHAVARWDDVPEATRPWAKAAMLYFIDCDDQISDADSPDGFDDDAAVVAACLGDSVGSRQSSVGSGEPA